MFDRYTDRALRVLGLAHDEVRLSGRRQLGVEHLLLGMIMEGECLAAQALDSLGIGTDRLSEAREYIRLPAGVSSESDTTPRHSAFTVGAKVILEDSMLESARLGRAYIGPEHILLALSFPDSEAGAENSEPALDLLRRLGVEGEQVYKRMLDILNGTYVAGAPMVLHIDQAQLEAAIRWFNGGNPAGPAGPEVKVFFERLTRVSA